MKRLACLVFALLLSLQGVACGADPGTGKDSSRAHAANDTEKETMKIKITAGGKVMTATMADNQTAKDFVALLPLTLTMDDLFEREKFAPLPRPVSQSGPRAFAFRVGQIAYWSPKNDVAVFYRHDGQTIPNPGIIVLGQIDTGTGAGVAALNVPGRVSVTFELAK